MIYFASKPTSLFCAVLENSLAITIDQLSMSIESGQPPLALVDDDIIAMFGGPERLREHLRELQRLLRCPKVYQISDYSYLVLDRLIRAYCEVYNDMARDDDEWAKEEIETPDVAPRHIDAEDLLEIYFWDQDYDFSPELFDQLSAAEKDAAGFSGELFGVIHRMQPHQKELEAREARIDIQHWEQLELE